MRNYIVLITICFAVSLASAQNDFEKELDSINDEVTASKFIENHKSNKGKLITFNKEKHNTSLAKEI